MSCCHGFGCIFILIFLDRPTETEGLDVGHGCNLQMLGRRKDGQFAMAVACRIRSGFNSSLWTLNVQYLGRYGIIRELKHAKLRVHKSMDIAILWRESVNG